MAIQAILAIPAKIISVAAKVATTVAKAIGTAAKAVGTAAKTGAHATKQTASTVRQTASTVKQTARTAKQGVNTYRKMKRVSQSTPQEQRQDNLIAQILIVNMAVSTPPRGMNVSRPAAVLQAGMKPVMARMGAKAKGPGVKGPAAGLAARRPSGLKIPTMKMA